MKDQKSDSISDCLINTTLRHAWPFGFSNKFCLHTRQKENSFILRNRCYEVVPIIFYVGSKNNVIIKDSVKDKSVRR